jgi:hypothetical protein
MIAACTNIAPGPMYSPKNALKPGETGIYVYSKHSPYRYIGGTGPELYLDGKLLGSLPNHGYFYKRLVPGAHVVAVKYKTTVLSSRTNDHPFQLDHHQIKYFEARWENSGRRVMMSTFTMVPQYEWRLHAMSSQEGMHDVTQLPLAQ